MNKINRASAGRTSTGRGGRQGGHPMNDRENITPVVRKNKEVVMRFISAVGLIAVFLIWALFHRREVCGDLDDYNGTGPEA